MMAKPPPPSAALLAAFLASAFFARLFVACVSSRCRMSKAERYPLQWRRDFMHWLHTGFVSSHYRDDSEVSCQQMATPFRVFLSGLILRLILFFSLSISLSRQGFSCGHQLGQDRKEIGGQRTFILLLRHVSQPIEGLPQYTISCLGSRRAGPPTLEAVGARGQVQWFSWSRAGLVQRAADTVCHKRHE